MGSQTVNVIIKEAWAAIWEVFQPLEMRPSSKQCWLDIAENFYRGTNFHNCLGTVDGKHT